MKASINLFHNHLLKIFTALGTFCDADTECHSKDEELSCQQQTDITRFSGVCMARLDEGATCGNAIRSMFDMVPGLFKRDEDSSNVCKKGLACRTVGLETDFVPLEAHITQYFPNNREILEITSKLRFKISSSLYSL